ncbi:Uu.00g024070.m01.CDS01 [Anthostomella pinea]|uniref:Uu.00g024070.m01.CDS01 n=1 Tax=Anthostomella pinea TaxID=933095 RepID=A0AAI8W080_9PEZI|nr:Uu.00g024070.m01.CDS01 [Anthostomella pinea]
MNPAMHAWECRDQTDQAELFYNQPLRIKNKRLEDENMALKRLLRENGIPWQMQPKSASPPNPFARVTRSSKVQRQNLPHLPVELQLRVLSYAVTSPHPIVDPLCKVKPERLLLQEKAQPHYIAIHFLATCKAYRVEGTKFLWTNNTFVFTSPEALRNFAELNAVYRMKVQQVTFRLIAKFYDDENRNHRIPRAHHPDLTHAVKLTVHKRPKENNLARRGFRAYAWYQLIDFLDALLPPFDPALVPASSLVRPAPRPRLLPSLEKLRIDFVNFGEDLFQYPPPQLHDLASHQLGCILNEVVLTGVPTDECGLRVSTELSGLLRDEGLLIDHAPTMVAVKNNLRMLQCDADQCHYSSKVVRAMRTVSDYHHHHFDDDHRYAGLDFPPAPKDEGEPPLSEFHSCRTIWKKVPKKLDGNDERKWELFDRVSGMPWEDIQEEATMFDMIDDDEEGITCENCGEVHPGALLPDELMDLYDDLG